MAGYALAAGGTYAGLKGVQSGLEAGYSKVKGYLTDTRGSATQFSHAAKPVVRGSLL